MSIELIKSLRSQTGAGIMECKKALREAENNLDKAIEIMRKTGTLKAHKKSERIAAEGAIGLRLSDDSQVVTMLEVNCETDFVARDENFCQFVESVTQAALESKSQSVDEVLAQTTAGGEAVEAMRQQLVLKIGENVQLRRLVVLQAGNSKIGTYLHGQRIGVVVSVANADEDLARDLAMHIAACRPQYISADEISTDVLEKEKEIYRAQMTDSNKPAEVMEKIIQGKIQKYINEVTLEGQAFVKDPDLTIAKLLKAKEAKVIAFSRFEVGEGIDKPTVDFAEDVQAQAEAAS